MKTNTDYMNRFKTIYIAGINRSGGSLLARLLDNHSDVLSYPMELGFPEISKYYDINENYAGTPQTISNFDHNEDNPFEVLEIPENKPTISTTWGKEKSDPLGVRENYLEKVFYGTIKTEFDYDKFKSLLIKYTENCNNIYDLYNARHTAYFKSWDEGQYFNNQKYLTMHSSGGIYLSNFDKYFNDFIDSKAIYPIRDIVGFVAAEKTRLARRFYGSRRFAWPRLPNYFVKNFDMYDLEGQIRSWLSAITRVRLMQEKYGQDNKLIVYRHENLTKDPQQVMRKLATLLNIDYQDTLIKPTIAGKDWFGNSHYGPVKGINNNIQKNYSQVLNNKEINKINILSSSLIEKVYQDSETIDLCGIPESNFFDYKYQKKYFSDNDKIVLYSSLINSSKRKVIVNTAPIYSIFAIIFSFFVRVMHIPRLFKLKYLKKRGKQNYT